MAVPPPLADPGLSDGVAALLGAVIGGLISVVGNYFVWLWQRRDESVRWRREDDTRFHAERRSAYGRFLSLVSDLYNENYGSAERGDDFHTRLQELSGVHAEISLIATTAVRENADALRVLIATAVANRDRFQGQDDVRARFLALAEEFRDTARAELGTPEKLSTARRK